MQVGVAKVDPELARDLAVDRPGTAIGRGRAGLLLRRHAPDLEMSRHEHRKCPRQHGPDLRQPLLDIGHDLGAALVAFAELVTRVFGERLHALPDRPLRVADRAEDRVHSRLQLI